MASTTIKSNACLGVTALLLCGCGGLYVSPLSPPPYRAEIQAPYDAAWTALVHALAKGNIPLRAIARDSGVIASDEFVTPIGVLADCGRIGPAAGVIDPIDPGPVSGGQTHRTGFAAGIQLAACQGESA